MSRRFFAALVLLLCGFVTAGAGGFILAAYPRSRDRWPDASPALADRTGTIALDVADRIWWRADQLWQLERVLMSFTLVRGGAEVSTAAPEPLPSSGELVEPPFRLVVTAATATDPNISISASEPLRSVLGDDCLERAVRPLLEREAKSGIWDHTASLLISYVTVVLGATTLSEPLQRAEEFWLPAGVILMLLGILD